MFGLHSLLARRATYGSFSIDKTHLWFLFLRKERQRLVAQSLSVRPYFMMKRPLPSGRWMLRPAMTVFTIPSLFVYCCNVNVALQFGLNTLTLKQRLSSQL